MSKRNWKSTALSVPVLLLAGGAYAQAAAGRRPDEEPDAGHRHHAAQSAAGDWLMWRRTYNGWGYSPLEQINKGNVKNLQVAWTWSLTNGATETTPIVHDGVLFIFNYADKVQALNAATGDLIWEYKRDLPAKLVAEGGNALAKRNMAIYDDKLIVATSDAHHRRARRQDRQGRLGPRDRRLEQGLALHRRPVRRQRHDRAGHDRLRQRRSRAAASSPATTPRPAPRSGASTPSRSPAIRTSTPGTACRWRAASALRPGSPAATIPSRTSCSTAPASPIRGSPRCAARCRRRRAQQNNALYSTRRSRSIPTTGKLKWYHQHLEDDTWDLDYVYERMLIDLPVNGETAQGGGHHRQARHHRGDRPHQRPVAVAQGDGAAERGRPRSIRRPARRPSTRRRSRTSARPR